MPTDGLGMFARIWVIKSDLFFYELLIFNKLIFGTQVINYRKFDDFYKISSRKYENFRK
jgi:hypothetical protein